MTKDILEKQILSKTMELGCFTVRELFANIPCTHKDSIIENMVKEGEIERIHDDLFVAIDSSTGFPLIDDRFVIASHLSEDAYITHHTACEYYGCYNQVYNWMYTSGGESYDTFLYDHIEFHYIPQKFSFGVVQMSNGVRVTDMERTVLDTINDLDEIDGLEEALKCIELFPQLDEVKMLKYLLAFNDGYLYQKVGYILSHYEVLKLSENFFVECQKKVPEKSAFLSSMESHMCKFYNKNWNLYVPENLYAITGKGAGTFYGEI